MDINQDIYFSLRMFIGHVTRYVPALMTLPLTQFFCTITSIDESPPFLYTPTVDQLSMFVHGNSGGKFPN